MSRRPHVRPAALFPSHTVEPPADSVVATIDGAARGNPGPAAYGVVFQNAGGKVLAQLASRLGRATNNVAEYRALLAALTYAREHHWRALRVRTDSELLARQLQGDYRVRSAELKPLHDQARLLIAALDYFSVEAVPRRLTRAADKLANAALDGRAITSAARLPRVKSRDADDKQTVWAVYEAGVLKPKQKLHLADGEEVELILRRRQ